MKKEIARRVKGCCEERAGVMRDQSCNNVRADTRQHSDTSFSRWQRERETGRRVEDGNEEDLELLG